MTTGTFTEGVSPGGLSEKDDIKLLIAYTLKKIDQPTTRTKLCEIIEVNNLANYFELNNAITEMINDSALICEIAENGEDVLILPQKSYYGISELEKMLPLTVRKKAFSAAAQITNRDKISKQCNVRINKRGNGYLVSFEIGDDGLTLFQMSLYTTTISRAELIKRNFCDNAVKFYSDVIASLATE